MVMGIRNVSLSSIVPQLNSGYSCLLYTSLFIISVSVLGGSLLAKQVLVKAISQAGIDTAISHRMMDAVFGYAGADDTQWIAKIQNKIEKNEEVQKITEKVMDEMVNDLSKGTGYKAVSYTHLDWITIQRVQ